MPTRLLFLNTRDQCGADVAVHLTLMKHLSPADVQVSVISNSEATDADDMRRRLAGLPQVRTRFLPLGRPAAMTARLGRVRRGLAYAPSVLSLAKAAAFVRKHGIQIVHSTDRPRDASYAVILARMTGILSVVHMHAHVTGLTRPTMWGLRNASAVFAVSDSIRANLMDIGLAGDRIHTLHNGVDVEFFDPDGKIETPVSVRAQFGIPATAPLACIAARMNPWKGHYELIGAASRLRETFPQLHVLILGADVPEMRRDFERAAREGGVAERIHFAGFQTDVRPFLSESDLFVHPSYAEPFGLSIVEAMAMRKPVIACGTGGVPEIITHGSDGWLVAERSPEAVADAIAALLDDRELRHRMGERARQTVSSRFTPGHQAVAASRHYARLITESAVAQRFERNH